MDDTGYAKYAAAGYSQFALPNYPQFIQLIYGTNGGLSWYNSRQVSLRRQVKTMWIAGNYTWRKSDDNISAEGNASGLPASYRSFLTSLISNSFGHFFPVTNKRPPFAS